jgi:hypothetical protein
MKRERLQYQKSQEYNARFSNKSRLSTPNGMTYITSPGKYPLLKLVDEKSKKNTCVIKKNKQKESGTK